MGCCYFPDYSWDEGFLGVSRLPISLAELVSISGYLLEGVLQKAVVEEGSRTEGAK